MPGRPGPFRAQKINAVLRKAHPDAKCALVHKNPLQLLVATILSAQCTDVRVNQVTPALFKRYPDAARLAKAPLPRLERMVRPTNVILGNCYGVPGITVDTHVKRLAWRMGLTKETDPDKIERDLMKQLPPKEWTVFSHRMIFHGRRGLGTVLT